MEVMDEPAVDDTFGGWFDQPDEKPQQDGFLDKPGQWFNPTPEQTSVGLVERAKQEHADKITGLMNESLTKGLGFAGFKEFYADKHGFDAEPLRQAYEQESAQRWAKAHPESALRRTLREDIPFASTAVSYLHNERVAEAAKRIKQGTPTKNDWLIMAQHEQEQKRLADRSIGEAVLDTAKGLPAFGIEMATGTRALAAVPKVGSALGMVAGSQAATRVGQLGQLAARSAAVTAVTPKMWMPDAQQRAMENGGDWFDPENIAPAIAHGTMTTAILGQITKNIRADKLFQDIAAKTGIGVGEQQIADAAAYATGLTTHAGSVQDFLEGKHGEGWKKLATQATMFAGFAGSHGIMDAFKAKVDAGATPKEIEKWIDGIKNELPEMPVPPKVPFDPAKDARPIINNPPYGPKDASPPRTAEGAARLAELTATPESPGFRTSVDQSLGRTSVREIPPEKHAEVGKYVLDELLAKSGPVTSEAVKKVDLEHLSRAPMEDAGESPKQRGKRYEVHPGQKLVTDIAKNDARMNPEGEWSKKYPDAKVIDPQLKEALARGEIQPLPLPNPKAAKEIGEAWEIVSSINPQIGELIKKVRVIDPAKGERGRAMFSPESGTLTIKKGSTYTPAELYHEVVHAEQHAEGRLKPHKERTDQEHFENEMEAYARMGQMERSGIFDRVREILAAKKNPAAAPAPPVPAVEPAPAVAPPPVAEAPVVTPSAPAVAKPAPAAKPLTDRQRQILELREKDEATGKPKMTHRQIAAKFGISERMVRKDETAALAALGKEKSTKQQILTENEAAKAERRERQGSPVDAVESIKGFDKERPLAEIEDPATAQYDRKLDQLSLQLESGKITREQFNKALESIGEQWSRENAIDPSDTGLYVDALRDQISPSAPESITTPQQAKSILSSIREGVRDMMYGWRQVSGQVYPHVHDSSPRAATALHELTQVSTALPKWLTYFKKAIIEPMTDYSKPAEKMTPEDKQRIGKKFLETFAEERNRHAVEVWDQRREKAFNEYQKADLMAKLLTKQIRSDSAADPKRIKELKKERDAIRDIATKKLAEARENAKKMAEVQTFVGVDGTELPSERAFQDTLANQGYKEFSENWAKHYAAEDTRLFKLALNIDAVPDNTQLPGRPLHMKPIREGEERPTDSVVKLPASKSGRLTNAMTKQLGLDKAYKGSAAEYDMNLERVVAHGFTTMLKRAKEAQVHRVLEEEGIARFSDKPVVVDGKRWEILTDVNPPKGSPSEGMAGARFYVDPRHFKDVKRAFDLNDRVDWNKYWVAQGLNMAAVSSFAEPISHGINLGKVNVLPGVKPTDIFKFAKDIETGSLPTLKRIAELAEFFSGKTHGIENIPEGFGKYDPTRPIRKLSGHAIDVMDNSVRLAADKAFDRLVDRGWVNDTAEQRRNFINQNGNYNKLSQHWFVAWLRDTGIGPFATAATNFVARGINSLALNPGIKGKDRASDLKLKAEFAARIYGTSVLTVAAINYAFWNNVFGDDNTPLFHIKLGTDSNGATMSFNMGQFAGLDRGLRSVGLMALLEGMRSGASANEITKRGVKDFAHSLAHPAEGPAASFALGAITGENAIGMPIAPDVHDKNFTTSFGSIGHLQKFQDLLGAVKNANPTLASALYWSRPRQKGEPSWWERWGPILAGFSPKVRKNPPVPDQEYKEIKVPVRK